MYVSTDEGSISPATKDSARLAVQLVHLVYLKRQVMKIPFARGSDPITGKYAIMIDLPGAYVRKEGSSATGAFFGE